MLKDPAFQPKKEAYRSPKIIFSISSVQKSFMNKLTNFLTQEALNLSVGYLAGLMASNLVSRFFVKRGLVNLWGLTARREALKKDQYEWLMYVASYVIGLAVLLAVQYGMRRLRGQRTVEGGRERE